MVGRPDLSFEAQKRALQEAASTASIDSSYGQAMQSAQGFLRQASQMGRGSQAQSGITPEVLQELWNTRGGDFDQRLGGLQDQLKQITGMDSQIDEFFASLPSANGSQYQNNMSSPATGEFDLDTYVGNAIQSESSGNPNAKNPLSSATGLAQFIDSTWQGLMNQYPDLGLTADGRTDPEQSKRAMYRFTQDNIANLNRANIPVDYGSVYASHFLGSGGAINVLRRNNNERVASIVGPDVIKANPFLRNMSVGDFRNWAASKGRRS